MRNIILKVGMFSILLFLGNSGIAQSKILDNYIKSALSNNLNVKSEFLKKDKQKSKVAQAKKLWKPNVDLNASYLFAKGGRTLFFPVGDLFNPVYGSLNQLTQTNDFPTDLENLNTQLTPNNYLDMQLSVSKPLINSSIKYNQIIQNELLRINDLDIELSKFDIAFQIKTSYYNYLKTFEGLKIIKETESLFNEVLRFNRKLVKYDKATPDVLSDIEFQIANLNSQRAMLAEQQELAKAYFNLLLNKPLDTEIVIDENLINGNFENTQNLTTLKSLAKQTRLEFKKLEVARGLNNLNQKRIDKERLPNLGVSAGVGLQTESFNFDNGGPLFTIGLGMDWNIFDGGLRKQKIQEIQIDQKILDNDRQRLNQQIEIETTQIYLKMQSMKIRMQSEEVAVRSAKKSYNAIKKKYKNDKAILIELIQSQNSLTTSELSKALTKYDYLIQLAELDKVIGKL